MLALIICLSTVSPSAAHDASSTLATDPVLGDPEIDALSRNLRMQVYESYRTEREQYNLRRRAAKQVIQGWTRSGQQESAQGLVLNWLQDAIIASRPGSVAGLPAIPTYSTREMGRNDTPQDNHLEPRVEHPTIVNGESVEPESRAPVEASGGLGDQDSIDEENVAQPSDRTDRSDPGEIEDRRLMKTPRILGNLGRAVYRAASSSRSPAAAGNEAGIFSIPAGDNGDRVDEGPETNVETEIQSTRPTPVATQPQVNLSDLEARVQGYNLALQSLEDALRSDGVWTPNRLTPIIDELAELADGRKVLNLYGDLLPNETRHLVNRLNSADFVMQLAEQKIEDARASIRSGETPSEPLQRQEQLQQLDVFARQPADLATDG